MNENLNELSDWVRLCDQRHEVIAHLKSLNAEQAKAIRGADGKLQAAAAEIARLRQLLRGFQSAIADVALAESAPQGRPKLSLAWPGTWQPVTEDNAELDDPLADDDRGVFVREDGRGIEFFCDGGELEGYFQLPDGYAICRRVQP